MRISYFLTPLAASLLLVGGLTACEKPGPGERAGKAVDQTMEHAGEKLEATAEKVEGGAASAGVALDDAAVTARIKTAYLAESGLKTLQIAVATVEGDVTLTGSVATLAQSDLARTMASGVAGVKMVTNNLVVTPAK